MEKIYNTLNKIKAFLEKTTVSPTQWIISFVAIIFGRLFLEALSSPSSSGIIESDITSIIHGSLWFITMAMIAMIFVWIILPELRKALPAGILFSFVAIWIAPTIDLIVSKGNGFKMTYLFQNFGRLVQSFYTFMNNSSLGVTTGIHVEVTIILICFALLFYSIRKNIKKTILATIALYGLIFFMFVAPSFLYISDTTPGSPAMPIISTVLHSSTLADNINGNLRYETTIALEEIGFDLMMSRIFIIALCVLIAWWFFLQKKSAFLAIMKNSRPERVLHYWLMAGAGMYIAWHISPWSMFSWNDALVFVTLLISIYAAWMFSVCTNDIADVNIDLVSNPGRPLPSGAINKDDIKEASTIFLLIALVGSYVAGYYAFFSISVFMSLYYVYSMPPTRLKRAPVLSSFIIILNCVSIFIAGFFTFSRSKILSTLPMSAIFAVIIISFLWSHIKDLKDVEGDTKSGIATVPVILGPVWGPRVIGTAGGLAYVIAALFIGGPLIYILALVWGIMTYYFCTRRPYKEWPLFVLYFSLVLIALIVLSIR